MEAHDVIASESRALGVNTVVKTQTVYAPSRHTETESVALPSSSGKVLKVAFLCSLN